MKYSANRYYVEKYVKCDICGKTVFQEDWIIRESPNGGKKLYCSEWCVQWEKNHMVK